MKSAEVYKEINLVLKPILKDIGFKKIGSSRPKWFKDYDSFSMHLYFKTHKYPWEPYKGCSLSLCAYICPLGTPLNEVECKPTFSRPFIRGGSIELLEVHRRNLLVAEKIRNLDLNEIFENSKFNFYEFEELKELHDSSIFLLNLNTDIESTELMRDTEIKYLDQEDVAFLAPFYKSIIIKNIEQLYNNEMCA